jgi:hypothetical protein
MRYNIVLQENMAMAPAPAAQFKMSPADPFKTYSPSVEFASARVETPAGCAAAQEGAWRSRTLVTREVTRACERERLLRRID